jgi:glucosamine--fructose-6-phosphate aminotransferase (isomerizing)
MAGERFESEIREQPEVWNRLARSRAAELLAKALRDDVVLVGSGSSLFVALLGALALRRRGLRAAAVAASEAAFERGAYRGGTLIALSQSGRSADILAAVDVLAPRRLVALTNDRDSPLAARAACVVDVEAGPELAVPASKSVTATAAILLWAAALISGTSRREGEALKTVAGEVALWLEHGPERVKAAAKKLAQRKSAAFVGAGYGVPVAFELALKLKEASYLPAEGFPAGEFRHGSAAILDAGTALVGIADETSRPIVERPLAEAQRTASLRYTLGADVAGIERLGPLVGEAFNTLAWLVTGQVLALETGRARAVDPDTPRGLSKFLA